MSTSRRDARRREILLAAAGVLAARDDAGMAEVAAAVGLARGTLYRYFPTRESLLRALEAAANEEAGRRLAEANLDQVPVEEALARVTRALVAVGEHFIVQLRERRPPEPGFTAPAWRADRAGTRRRPSSQRRPGSVPGRVAARPRRSVCPDRTSRRDGLGGHQLDRAATVSHGSSSAP